MKAAFKLILILIGSFLLSVFVNPKQLDYLVSEVIFTASYIMVGLTIAIISIFMGNINRLYLSLLDIFNRNKSITEDEKKNILNKLNDIKKELKQNVTYTILAFVVIIILFFFKQINIPEVEWPLNNFTKDFLSNVLITSISFSIILAVYDSINGAFSLSNAVKLTKKKVTVM